MAMSITINPVDMSKEEREACCAFILEYPQRCPVQLDDNSHVKPEQAFNAGNAAQSPAAAEVFQTAPEVVPVSSAPLPPGIFDQPPAVAPAAPAPAPALNLAVLDSAGLPWDHRIHAETKGKIANGTWRKKKNLDPNLLTQVEAELRALMGVPAAPVAPVVPAVPVAPVVPAVPVPPPAPVAPTGTMDDFIRLIGQVATENNSGRLSQEAVAEICASVGVASLPSLAQRLDLIPEVQRRVNAKLGV